MYFIVIFQRYIYYFFYTGYLYRISFFLFFMKFYCRSLFMALFFYRRWSIVLQKLQRNTDIFKGGKKIQNRFRRLLFSTDSFRIPNSDYRTNIRNVLLLNLAFCLFCKNILCLVFAVSMLDRNRRMKEILYEIGYENLCSNWILFECESSFPNSAGESKISKIFLINFTSYSSFMLYNKPFIMRFSFLEIKYFSIK